MTAGSPPRASTTTPTTSTRRGSRSDPTSDRGARRPHRRSVHAIRWYEGQGLIRGVQRDGGGRRVYTELHLNWLDLMDRLRRTGMSIAGMRQYTALVRQRRSTLKERRELLAAHRTRVRETIAEWQLALELIDGKIDYYGEWIETAKRPAELPRVRGPVPAKRARRKAP